MILLIFCNIYYKHTLSQTKFQMEFEKKIVHTVSAVIHKGACEPWFSLTVFGLNHVAPSLKLSQ